MKIQVLGSGCPTCKKLFEVTERAVSEIGLGVKVEYIDDAQKIIQMGLIQSPVLAIDDKPVMVGFTSDIEKIKNIITNSQNQTEPPKASGCSCSDKC